MTIEKTINTYIQLGYRYRLSPDVSVDYKGKEWIYNKGWSIGILPQFSVSKNPYYDEENSKGRKYSIFLRLWIWDFWLNIGNFKK